MIEFERDLALEIDFHLDMTNDDQSSVKFYETASRILYESIHWLYLIPSFKQLEESDRFALIEQSWTSLFLLTTAETKKFLESRTNLFSPKHQSFIHLSFYSDQFDSLADDNDYHLFQNIIKELLTHSIDQTEYTLLKLILTFANRKSCSIFQ